MTAATSGPAVVVGELSKRFGAFIAVDRVSFEVGTSEIFGFLGPNGAGKTTTIKMLTGLLLPSSGRGTVAGYDIMTETEAIKRNIGYMSQLFSLYADLTVDENIGFFAGLYGVTRARRAERRDWVLEMAGLTDHRARLTGELPLGWKQRLALGCAVLHEPPLLFLDEPTSGVDPISRRQFWDLISDLAERGTTVFVSTHYMEEAEYCHRLALMNRGKLIALDTPSRLRASMAEPILDVRTSDSPKAVEALQGDPVVLDTGLFGRNVHAVVRDLAEARAAIPERLAARGVTLLSLEPIAPSLEDVFVARVRAEGARRLTSGRGGVSLTRLLAMARKETIQLRRDSRSLALAFLLPALLLLLFGYAITWDVTDIRTAVVDQDASPRSRELLDAFRASGYFTLASRPARASDLVPLLDRGQVQLGLVIPPGFAADLDAGRPAPLQAIVDGSDANTASIVLGYTQGTVRSFSCRILAQGAELRLPIRVQSRVWYNEELRSRNMIVPGLVAVIMMIIAAMLTSLTIAREWERGTMEQLAATPVRRIEVVLGKLLPYLAIGLIDVLVVSLLGVVLFDVPFRGSPVLFLVLTTAFLVGALGLGMFISAVARSQLLATQMAMVATFLPAFLLSGFMYAIEVMPPPLQAVTYLVPARYFLVVTRGIFLKGVGIEVLRVQGLLMIAFGVLGLLLATRAFKKVIG